MRGLDFAMVWQALAGDRLSCQGQAHASADIAAKEPDRKGSRARAAGGGGAVRGRNQSETQKH